MSQNQFLIIIAVSLTPSLLFAIWAIVKFFRMDIPTIEEEVVLPIKPENYPVPIKPECKPVKEKPIPTKLRMKDKSARQRRNYILKFINRETSLTAVDISRLSGYSLTSVRYTLKELYNRKKVVILVDGRLYRYVLPSEGQKVFKTKI